MFAVFLRISRFVSMINLLYVLINLCFHFLEVEKIDDGFLAETCFFLFLCHIFLHSLLNDPGKKLANLENNSTFQYLIRLISCYKHSMASLYLDLY